MKKLILLAITFVMANFFLSAQTVAPKLPCFFFQDNFIKDELATEEQILKGLIQTNESKEAICCVNIRFFQNGKYIDGTTSDLDGWYQIELPAGNYKMETTHIGYPTDIQNISIKENNSNEIDISLKEGGVFLDEIVVVSYLVTKKVDIRGCGNKKDEAPELPIKKSNHTPPFNFNIYPNPSSGLLQIELTEGKNNIEIFNLAGKKIVQFENQRDAIFSKNLSYLAGGIYLVKIKNGKKVVTKRWVIANK